MLHFFNQVGTSDVGEHGEPVNIWTGLRDSSEDSEQESMDCSRTSQSGEKTHRLDQLVSHDAAVVLVNVALLPILEERSTCQEVLLLLTIIR